MGATSAQVPTEIKPSADTNTNASATAKPAPLAIPVPGMTPPTDLVTPASENPEPDRSALVDAIKG